MTTLERVTGPSGTGKSTFVNLQSDWTNVWNLHILEREALGTRRRTRRTCGS